VAVGPAVSRLGCHVLQRLVCATRGKGLFAWEAGLGSEVLIFWDGPTRGSRCHRKCHQQVPRGTEVHGLLVTAVWPWGGHVTTSSLSVPTWGFGLDLFHFISFYFILLFLKDFTYLFERVSEREMAQAGGVGEGEAGFPPSREPDAGLDPSTLGS